MLDCPTGLRDVRRGCGEVSPIRSSRFSRRSAADRQAHNVLHATKHVPVERTTKEPDHRWVHVATRRCDPTYGSRCLTAVAKGDLRSRPAGIRNVWLGTCHAIEI